MTSAEVALEARVAMTPTEVAWLAGIIEGEGCIDSTRTNPRLRVKMSDPDVVLRAADLMGARWHLDNYGLSQGHRQQYVAQITGERAAEVIREVLPYLGSRRTAKATAILLAHAAAKRLRAAK